MIIRAVTLGVCLVVIVSAGVVFNRDFRVAFLLRGTTNDQIDTFTASHHLAERAASARTLRDLLHACARLKLLAPRLKAQPEVAQRLRARCGAYADQVLRDAPLNARARAVAVLMAPTLRAADLAAAQAAAPYEPWPLFTRISAVAAADGAGGDLDAEVQRLARDDFARALQSYWGREVMAGIYVQHVALRPVVHDALRGLAPGDQRDFLRRSRLVLAPSG